MTEKNDSGSKLVLAIVYEQDPGSDWVVASIPAVPGVLSQGKTREEARENVLDALALMLSPEPVEAGMNASASCCGSQSMGPWPTLEAHGRT